MMYPSNLRKFLTFSVRSNKSTNKMANDVQIKLIIPDV